MKKILAISLLLVTSGIGLLVFGSKNNQPILVTPEATTSIPNPSSTPEVIGVVTQDVGNPITLTIPKIQVLTKIEPVAKDVEGNMDVPKSYETVGWYRLGPKPGETGSSVMAGHLDSPTGKAVFYNLSKLEVGDTVEVKDDQGKVLVFEVTRKETFADSNFPIKEVFSKKDKPRLNLITCEGAWDKNAQNYSHRTVVFTELVLP